MKETKVYVDKLPKSCWDCFCQDNENSRCKILEKYTDYVPKDCPLIDIKTHDRELVRQVYEKIARNVRVRKIKEEWYAIETDLRAILDQIQKEVEDE